MNRDLKKLLDFVRFTHEFRNVERAILFETNKRTENDMEHSYQMALVGWFIIEEHKLKLDVKKVLGMSLVHDLIEVHAGDVPLYKYGTNVPKAKIAAEKAAVKKLKKQWPGFKSMHTLIHEYEVRKSPEALFVYAVDQLMPLINNYLYDGRIWKREGLDLEWVKEVKAGKTDRAPAAHKYYEQLLKVLEKHPELFGRKDLKIYNKLVRDKIPAVVKASGKQAKTRTLKKRQYRQELIKKLREEVDEFAHNPSVEELADLNELLIALREDLGVTTGKLEKVRLQKAAERGRFKKKIFLESVE